MAKRRRYNRSAVWTALVGVLLLVVAVLIYKFYNTGFFEGAHQEFMFGGILAILIAWGLSRGVRIQS